MGNHASQRWARPARFRRGRPPCLPISFEGMGRRASRDSATPAATVRNGAERGRSIRIREPGNHGGLPLRVADDDYDRPGFSRDAMPGRRASRDRATPAATVRSGVDRGRSIRIREPGNHGGLPLRAADDDYEQRGFSLDAMPGRRASRDSATPVATVHNAADQGTSIRIREPGNHGGLPLRVAADGYDRPGFSLDAMAGRRASRDRATRAATVRSGADRGTAIRIREPGNYELRATDVTARAFALRDGGFWIRGSRYAKQSQLRVGRIATEVLRGV